MHHHHHISLAFVTPPPGWLISSITISHAPADHNASLASLTGSYATYLFLLPLFLAPLASLILSFMGVRLCILPWSQTLPETKKLTNVACYQIEVRDFFYETCVPRRSARFLTTFSSSGLYSILFYVSALGLVDNYIPTGPPPLSDPSTTGLLCTRS